MIKRGLVGVFALLNCSVCFGGSAILTTPAGLNPGDRYQLLFVTADFFTATSTDISVYNAEVNAEAALNPLLAAFDSTNHVTWRVVGSTATVNANVNAPSSGKVYTLNGVLIADAAKPLYSTGMCIAEGCTLYAPPDINQYGITQIHVAWTGMNPGGVASPQPLGNPINGVTAGGPNITSFGWYSAGAAAGTNSFPLYALSSVITVPATAPATPIPSTFLLAGIGMTLAGLYWMRYRRRDRA